MDLLWFAVNFQGCWRCKVSVSFTQFKSFHSGYRQSVKVLLLPWFFVSRPSTIIYMFPKRVTAIVIAQIANALNDYLDWLGELLVQTPFDESHKHDCIHGANENTQRSFAFAPSNITKLDSECCPKPKLSLPLVAYIGPSFLQWTMMVWTWFCADQTVNGFLAAQFRWQVHLAGNRKMQRSVHDRWLTSLTRIIR